MLYYIKITFSSFISVIRYECIQNKLILMQILDSS